MKQLNDIVIKDREYIDIEPEEGPYGLNIVCTNYHGEVIQNLVVRDCVLRITCDKRKG